MIKKSLFKKITALALATCLATSPAVIYAADDAEAVFVEEQETVESDEASSDEGYAEEVFTEDVNEEENIEETATEEPEFVGDDVVVIEDSEPEFVEDTVFEEQAVTEDVAAAEEAFGVDDTTMEMIVAGGKYDVVDDVVSEDTVDDDAALAETITVNFYGTGGGSTTLVTSPQRMEKNVSTKLTKVDRTVENAGQAFVGWSETSGGTVKFKDGEAVRFAEDKSLYAVWGKAVATSDSDSKRYATLSEAFDGVAGLGDVTLLDNNAEAATVGLASTFKIGSFNYSGKLTLSAGVTLTIEGTGKVTTIPTLGSGAQLLLRGGTYTSDVTKYCDSGYSVVKSGAKEFTVVDDHFVVAKFGGYAYTSFAYAVDALNASTSGGTITICKDEVTLESDVTVKKALTISKDDDKVSTENAVIDCAGHYLLFNSTLTIDDDVTFSRFNGAFAGETVINGMLAGDASNLYVIGKTLSLDDKKDKTLHSLNLVYSGAATLTGSLEAGDAESYTTGTEGFSALGTVVWGVRGSTSLNLVNVLASGDVPLNNDKEYTGDVKNTLVNNFGYTPTSVGSYGTGTISLDNSVFNATSFVFGNLGTRALVLKNGSQLKSEDDLEVLKNSTITMDYKSKITAKSWTNNGKLVVDLAGIKASDLEDDKKVIATFTTAPDEIGTVELKNNSGYGLKIDGKTLVLTKGVAQIVGDDEVYPTLEAALEAAEDGDTVELLGDETISDAFSITKNITLDLDENIITNNEAITIAADKKVTIKAANDGSISGTVLVKGGLTLESGKIGNVEFGDQYKATVTISGGEVTTITQTTGTLTITGGTIGTMTVGDASATVEKNYPTTSITGGKFTEITVIEKFSSFSVKSSLTDVISKVTPPTTATYVWTSDGTTNTLVPLQKAFEKDGTVVLSDSIALKNDEAIDVKNKVVLDLNGKVLSGTGSTKDYVISVKRGGSLTVINKGNAEGKITSSRTYAIRMNPDDKKTSTANAVLAVGSSSNSTQNYFSIEGNTYAIGGEEDYPKTDVTINGGTVSGATAAIYTPQKSSTVTINGGTIESTSGDAIYVSTGSTTTIKNGEITGKNAVAIEQPTEKASEKVSVTISGGELTGSANLLTENQVNSKTETNVTISVTAGYFTGTIATKNAKRFLEGGFFFNDPSDYVANGYRVDEISGQYPYSVVKDIPAYTLTLKATNNTSATLTSDPESPITSGTSVKLTASAAPEGYVFDNWYNKDTAIGTKGTLTATYTMPSANTELEARYLKLLTVTAPTESVTLGSDYKADLTKIVITGMLDSDKASDVAVTTNAKVTAPKYVKDSAKVGDQYDTEVTGVTVATSAQKKYTIDSKESYKTGKLTVIESATAANFVKAVAALPTADKATAANRAAVDAAKTMYNGLSTAEKNQADVKAAKTQLDAVDTAVTNHEKADAADALIKALPAAKDATSADREKLDEATKAFNALTDDQKKLVPAADQTKLADVTKAVEAAEKADKEAAAAVKNLIDALPTVAEATAADRDALTEAQEAYDALTPAQKKLLPGAEATLEALDEVITAAENDKKAADAVTAKINALPDPEDATKEDREKVDAAKDALADLTPAQQKLVPQTAKDRLEAVDEAVKAKEGGDDQKAADACMEKINAIKKQPAGKGKAATEEARAAYDALTDAQKALLPKSAESLLTAAEEAYTKDRTFQCGDNWYKVLPSGNVSYNRPADSDCTSATVPNQIKKNGYMYKVVKVSIGAFKNCTSLEWVVINKNIQIIGEYAFKNTPSLTKIKVLTRQLKGGKVVKAFAAGGKSNGAKLTVKTPSTYVAPYDSLFKGEGLLNQKATVKAA